MIPRERSLADKLKDKPFALLGVNSDEDNDALKQRLTAEQMPWRHFFDGSTEGPIATKWNVSAWPTTYVIDAEGVIRGRDLRDERAEQMIEKLLAELAAKGKQQAR